MENENVPRTQIIRMTGCKLKEVRTKKIVEFEKIKDADDFLGRAHGYTSTRIRKNQNAFSTKTGKEYLIIPGKTSKVKISVERRGVQPCWTCQKASGFCSWSKNLTPINGWVAEKTNIYYSKWDPRPGYAITECPEFIHD